MHNHLPALSDLQSQMVEPLRAVFSNARAQEISLLQPAQGTTDGATKLIYKDQDGKPLAVGLCSVPEHPDFVASAVSRARSARSVLDEQAGRHVLTPLLDGQVSGLSFAFFPFCQPLSDARLIWPLQRRLLIPKVLAWLREAVAMTCEEPAEGVMVTDWLGTIRAMAEDDRLPLDLRGEAARTAAELERREWNPKQALAHNDLWKGNILINKKPSEDHRSWSERFVLIDWAGSCVRGKPMYDLIRLAESLRLSPALLEKEIAHHCRTLGCAKPFARSYLVAALAHLLANLGYFHIERFVRTARTCLRRMDAALR